MSQTNEKRENNVILAVCESCLIVISAHFNSFYLHVCFLMTAELNSHISELIPAQSCNATLEMELEKETEINEISVCPLTWNR